MNNCEFGCQVQNLSRAELLAPFKDWSGDSQADFFGLVVDRNGEISYDPYEERYDLVEWHVTYLGKEIYEIECCPQEAGGRLVYQGKIPSRQFFVQLMANFRDAPKVVWTPK